MLSNSKLCVVGLAASLAFSVVMLAEPDDADAQRRYQRARPRANLVLLPRGLYFGGGVAGAKILTQSGGPELLDDGLGLTLYGGLRVSRTLALELGWIGTAHNPETVDVGFGPETDFLVLNGLTADAKIFLGATKPAARGAAPLPRGATKPYLQGGLGVYFLDSGAFGTQSVGTGFQLGGGLDWVVGRYVDLGLRGLYRGMAMGPPGDNQEDTFISAVTLEANLSLRF